jgi:hypothetical protein
MAALVDEQEWRGPAARLPLAGTEESVAGGSGARIHAKPTARRRRSCIAAAFHPRPQGSLLEPGPAVGRSGAYPRVGLSPTGLILLARRNIERLQGPWCATASVTCARLDPADVPYQSTLDTTSKRTLT